MVIFTKIIEFQKSKVTPASQKKTSLGEEKLGSEELYDILSRVAGRSHGSILVSQLAHISTAF